MYKNIEKQTALELREQVDYQAGQIISRTLVQNELMSMTLFAFEKGEEISTHAAGGDAMVTVLEGVGRFTVGGDVFVLTEGETLVMPKDVPHAVYGQERFKMLAAAAIPITTAPLPVTTPPATPPRPSWWWPPAPTSLPLSLWRAAR